MNRRKKLDDILRSFNARYRDLGEKVAAYALKLIDKGKDPAKAVHAAFVKYNVESFMLSNTIDLSVKAVCYGFGVEPTFAVLANKGLTEKAVSLTYSGSRVELSKNIHHRIRIAEKSVADTITFAIKQNIGIEKAALKLFEGYGYGQKIGLEGVKVNGVLKELAELEAERIKRFAVNGIPLSPDKATLNSIRSMQRYINRLKTIPLRTAYNELLAAVRKGNVDAISKAMYTAVQEKSRSHALMIAQTETSRAFGNAFESRCVYDEDVSGIKYSLNSAHKIYDICNLHTAADFGYGPGVYPLRSIPRYPFHPRCMCRMSEVFIDEVKPNVNLTDNDINNGVKKYLKGVPEGRRKDLMGIVGAEAFAETGSWEKSLRNWGGHKAVAPVIAKDDFY